MRDDVYDELIDEVRNLQISLADTKQQLAESTSETKKLRKLFEQQKWNNKATTAKGPPSNEAVPTGVNDNRGRALYYEDKAWLLTASTGSFLRLNKFQEGDTVIVFGVTKNFDLRVRDPNNAKLKTVRKGDSLLRIGN